ncbi:hypothetical protein [Microvirga arabica]|uniref:hypothetical protein n=1 Tax=Microvirga arabica TaxID=1128671 RepID=UPI00193928EB|nr:hypothetical protein [Microvirga arabica]MBM1171915.1 hypothetical protein [Microvirga arabica]
MEIATQHTLERPVARLRDESQSAPSFVEALVDPVTVFDHPREVAKHPGFTHQEKRTILLSWARDELVAEQVTSRLAPELGIRSRIDAVVEALATFDSAAAAEYTSAVALIRSRRGKRRLAHHSEGREVLS